MGEPDKADNPADYLPGIRPGHRGASPGPSNDAGLHRSEE